jgi:hypothetical protein
MRANRIAAKARRWLRALVVVAVFAALAAGAVVVAMFASALGTVEFQNWVALLHIAPVFALFGATLGTIMALDCSAQPTLLPRWVAVPFNAPRTRAALCAAWGAGAVALFRSWSPETVTLSWVFAGAVVGFALGWWGWRWAKYVDF